MAIGDKLYDMYHKTHEVEKNKYRQAPDWNEEWMSRAQIHYDAHITFNTLKPSQDGRQFPDNNFKCISLNENTWIASNISMKYFPKGPINIIPALVQKMARHRSGDKPLSEPIMNSLLTHIKNEFMHDC